MGRHSSPSSEAELEQSATTDRLPTLTAGLDQSSVSGGPMAAPEQDKSDGEPTRTWSHGGQQAGWRKQKSSVALQPRDLRLTDWIVFLAGPLALAGSFFDYYVHDSAQEFGDARRVSGAWTAWPAIWGAASVTLAAVASLLALLLIVGLNQGRSVARRGLVLGVFVLAVAAAVAAYVKEPQYSFGELDLSFNHPVRHTPGWGYWGCAVLILAGLVAAGLRLRELRAASSTAGGGTGNDASQGAVEDAAGRGGGSGSDGGGTPGYVGSRRA